MSGQRNASMWLSSTLTTILAKNAVEASTLNRSRKISFTPALYKIFDEILANAADNVQRDSKMSKIYVDIDDKSGQISIFNDGESILCVCRRKRNVHTGISTWQPNDRIKL